MNTIGRAFGWLYLFIRYQSKEKRLEVLEKEYDGSYGLVALDRMLMMFAILLGIGFLGFIGIVVVNIVKKYW